MGLITFLIFSVVMVVGMAYAFFYSYAPFLVGLNLPEWEASFPHRESVKTTVDASDINYYRQQFWAD